MVHPFEPSHGPSSRDGRLRGARILLAEDDAVIAEVLKDQLLDLGCAVLGPVNSVDEGVSLLGAHRPDVALLDLALADGNAAPLARALAELGVPFALLTGAGPDGRPDGLRDVPLIDKPFGLESVVLTLANLLHRPRS